MTRPLFLVSRPGIFDSIAVPHGRIFADIQFFIYRRGKYKKRFRGITENVSIAGDIAGYAGECAVCYR